MYTYIYIYLCIFCLYRKFGGIDDVRTCSISKKVFQLAFLSCLASYLFPTFESKKKVQLSPKKKELHTSMSSIIF